MNKPLTITELSRMGGKARWKTSNKKDRSEAMKKVRAARTAKQKSDS